MIRAQFAADPSAVAAARRLVSGTLRDWRVPVSTVDDGELVISELVTNAFLHGHAPTVTVELDHPGADVTLAVEHDEPHPVDGVAPLHVTAEQTHGRGLAIVDVLAREWRVEQHDGHRRVWCLLDAEPDGDAPRATDPLARLEEQLRGAGSLRAVGDAFTEWASEVFATDFASIALAEDEGRTLRFLSVEPLPPASAAVWAQFPSSTEMPVAAAFRRNRAYFHETGTAAAAGFPEAAPALDGAGMAALADVPLVDADGPIGTLSLAWRHGRVMESADRANIIASAQIVAAAIARIRSGDSGAAGTS